jgi:hypothetical protein
MLSADEMNEQVRTVLLQMWDPIGVANVATARDEYDAYVAPLAQMMRQRRSAAELSRRLLEIETGTMGLPGDQQRARLVAEKLVAIATLQKHSCFTSRGCHHGYLVMLAPELA